MRHKHQRIHSICYKRDGHTANIRQRLVLYHRKAVSSSSRTTVGCCAFAITGACIWNDLRLHVMSSSSLLTLKQPLNKNAHISSVLSRSHLAAVQTANCFLFVALEEVVHCLGNVKKLD